MRRKRLKKHWEFIFGSKKSHAIEEFVWQMIQELF